MSKLYKDLTILTFITLLLTFLIWLPHLLQLNSFFNLNFSTGFNTIYRNYDGMEYIIVAKTWYNPEEISKLPQSLPAIYYSSRFPLFPALILFFAPFLGYLKSMLFITQFFTIASVIGFYFLVKDFKLTRHPLFLSILFLLLPARWVIVHSVGSVEPLFIFLVILSLYFFMKFEESQKWVFIHLAGLLGMLAQLTRSPGILLFAGYGLYIAWKILKRVRDDKQPLFQTILKAKISYHPLLLIPLSLLGIFFMYLHTYGNFFAYFNSGDNIHLFFPPFQVFNKAESWVGDIWLEDIIYIFIIGFSGALLLLKQKLYPLAFFVLTFLSASILVAHRDISRYTLPIFPFILIAFEKFLTTKEFKIVLIIVALGIYLYSQNFILNNTAPIPNVELFN